MVAKNESLAHLKTFASADEAEAFDRTRVCHRNNSAAVAMKFPASSKTMTKVLMLVLPLPLLTEPYQVERATDNLRLPISDCQRVTPVRRRLTSRMSGRAKAADPLLFFFAKGMTL
jgi:hypothetical protein